MFYVIKEQGNLWLREIWLRQRIFALLFFYDWAVLEAALTKMAAPTKCTAHCRWDANTFSVTQTRRNMDVWEGMLVLPLKRTDNHPCHDIYKLARNVDVEWRRWMKWGVLHCFAISCKALLCQSLLWLLSNFPSDSNMFHRIMLGMLYSLPQYLPVPRTLTSLKPKLRTHIKSKVQQRKVKQETGCTRA